jgi:hypothetical protein
MVLMLACGGPYNQRALGSYSLCPLDTAALLTCSDGTPEQNVVS